MSPTTKGPRFYRTTKGAQEHVAELLAILGSYEGVSSYHVRHEGGDPVEVAFVVWTGDGEVPYRLRPNFEGLRRRLEQASRSDVASAQAVGWAQVKAHIETMLELVESSLLTPAQVFGGLAVTSGGATVAEIIEGEAGQLDSAERLLLEPPDETTRD